MHTSRLAACALLMLCAGATPAAPTQQQPAPQPVNIDNFNRAETDTYFAKFVKAGALGKFVHTREPAPVDKQDVIRMNRDTLYSQAVVDLDAGPVTVVLPVAGKRYMALQVINEDHYTPAVVYKPGGHSFDKASVGTRYALLLVRTFADPNDAADLKTVNALQDSIRLEQGSVGRFEVPNWDPVSLKNIRDALNALSHANGGLDSARMFGPKDKVDPVQHLLGTAGGWGGNPLSDACYSGVVPEKNDGKTVYRLTVREVPVDGFWSISVYNKDGYFEKNALNRYSVNNVTAQPNADKSTSIQFGGCDANTANCLPIMPGWNYVVRMYRPRKAILDGSWQFPEAKPAS